MRAALEPVGRVVLNEPLDGRETRPTRLAGDRLALPSGSWEELTENAPRGLNYQPDPGSPLRFLPCLLLRSTAFEAHAPICLFMASQMSLLQRSSVAESRPSIMNRAFGSVPEYRSSTRPPVG